MESSSLAAEKNFTSSLISALSSADVPPSKAEIEDKAKRMAELFGYTGDLDGPVEEVMIAIDSRMGQGVSLVDFSADHDDEWCLKRDVGTVYSEAYEKYLRDSGWSPKVVQSLSDVSLKILGHLQDPKAEGLWDRRGLVIGHVQSGKTANYLGLISRAADAGYKVIIVIAGIHNNLRRQTQERVDEGFVGRSSDPDNRNTPIGVGGFVADFPHPVTLTTIYDDFNKQTAAQSGWRINDLSKPLVLVIKKNVSTLTNLYTWLKDLNAKGHGQITDAPLLMIDDEADNASINTNKDDVNPTRTNALLRRLLGLFDKSCYVGYTATPFANIFIRPDDYDDEVKEELFPRDFIYSLDAPNTYFGPGKVFLDDESSARILRPITDAEDLLPLKHKKEHDLEGLPPSLYEAVNIFVLTRAIRNVRKQTRKHTSMMINVSRFVSMQREVRDLVSVYVKKLHDAVKANYSMPEAHSERNQYMSALKTLFVREFGHCSETWEVVKAELFDAVDAVRIYTVNSKSDEVLDYRRYEKDGQGLTAIAVGGLSLSRGLTIEGLTVSYMYRNTRMYDTLMQMGRWFGYRGGYEDLCRVYLSPDSINWYAHIANAAEELRQQIRQMRRDKLTPREFGLYVEAHPDSLLITATNKMRSGQKFTVRQNFSGKLVESYILPCGRYDDLNDENRNLVREYLASGFGKGRDALVSTQKGWLVKDAATADVEEFLQAFRVHKDFSERRNGALAYLRLIQDKYEKADVLFISPGGKDCDQDNFGLGYQERHSATMHDTYWRLAKDRVASRGDEKLGLDDDQIKAAKEAGDKGIISDFYYRKIRQKPLLMIHSLELGAPENRDENIPAFGISFPFGDYSQGVEVVANQVWVDQMHGGNFDDPDEEDD